MTISFNCTYCGKKIEAKDSAGGKWGKCPACHNKLYVPSPDTDEELKLAPIDEGEEERTKRLIAETRRLTHDILSERESLSGATGGPIPEFQADKQQLVKNIIAYLQNMVNGELDQAEIYAKLIIPLGDKAVKVLDEIAVSEIPEPELADIPQNVLAGLIRKLRAQIR
jgi:hypothetical protein